MIKRLLCIILILISVRSEAQESEINPRSALYTSGDFGLGLSGIYLQYPDFATRNGFGLNLHYAVNGNVLLNWHLHFGNQYFSTSLWVPLGPLLFSASVLSGNISRESLALILLSALPDGVSFPLRISNKFYITPTINPLNLDMFGKDPAYKRFYINGNISLGFHYKTKYFNFHPFGGIHLLYTRGPYYGFSGGLELELRISEIKRNKK